MKKTTEEFAKQLLVKWGLTLESEYDGAAKPVTFKCANGHTNSTSATNVLQRGYKCKECLTGRKIISKIQWTDVLIKEIMLALESNLTEEVAVKYNTTASAINNMIAKNGFTNPRDRMLEAKLCRALIAQDRELISFVGDMATIKCTKGHTHVQEIGNILHHNTGCPSCFSLGTSRVETELQEFIASIYKGWVVHKDRTILKPKELDIVLPDEGIAIEFNGTYWHREEKIGKSYHKDKTEAVEAFGYQLIHIKDYDWMKSPHIVKSILRSKLGISNTRIFARKCILKDIPFPHDFLTLNHIQGSGQPTSINKGLFYNGELVAVATFGKPRFSNEAELELIRFCSKLDTTVVGGLSKMLPKDKSILSYANRDYSVGKGYLAAGFKFIRKTDPGLEYYCKNEKMSRYAAQSASKEELARFHKYYNSGNLVFIKTP